MAFPSELLGPGACHVVLFNFRLYFFLHYPLFSSKAKHYTGIVFALKVCFFLLLLPCPAGAMAASQILNTHRRANHESLHATWDSQMGPTATLAKGKTNSESEDYWLHEACNSKPWIDFHVDLVVTNWACVGFMLHWLERSLETYCFSSQGSIQNYHKIT